MPLGSTFVVAIFTGMIAVWVLHLGADVLLGGYVFLLVQLKQRGSVTGVGAQLAAADPARAAPAGPPRRPPHARHPRARPSEDRGYCASGRVASLAAPARS